MLRPERAAQMISLSVQPLHEPETAHELAQAPLTDHNDPLPDRLAAFLSSLRTDLAVVIDDRRGVTGDAGPDEA